MTNICTEMGYLILHHEMRLVRNMEMRSYHCFDVEITAMVDVYNEML